MSQATIYQSAREQFKSWQENLKMNLLLADSNLMHTYQAYFPRDAVFLEQLPLFAKVVSEKLEPLVMENNQDGNLPQLMPYTALGERDDKVVHHPSYIEAGNLIYGSGLMGFLREPGQLLKTLSLFLLASHAGEAGHNCPIACSAGVMRLLTAHPSLPFSEYYIEKLATPSFSDNFTGAQFLTEVQGGSDVGANACVAFQNDANHWSIQGEKWFCSNVDAELILLTARFSQEIPGTKGLGLFLVPRTLENGKHNAFKIRRLKQKIGTRSMPTGEIDFEGALAYPVGELAQGIHLALENVLHVSRIFNAFSVLGMSRRAYQIAYYYAAYRTAFERTILTFPLVKETLAKVKATNTALLASIFRMASYQDKLDAGQESLQEPGASAAQTTADAQSVESAKLLLRVLANLNKYYTAKWAVENIHHCLDILAGNGTIETFSSLPRLLRDAIVCENWEGTHFVLWMQILKDILKRKADKVFLMYLRQLHSQLTPACPYKDLFSEQFILLEAAIQQLKMQTPEQQSLEIKAVVEQMAFLHAAICLSLEVVATTADCPASKKAALALFLQEKQFLQPEATAYLALLEAVLS